MKVVLFVTGVGVDDALHQGMSHHVAGVEEGHADAFLVLQDLQHLPQAGLTPRVARGRST